MLHRKTLLRRGVFFLLALLLPFSTLNAQRIQLPDLGDPAESALSVYKEREIGQEIMLQIYAQNAVIEDLLVQEYINYLGYQLLSRADSALHDFTFFVINENSINAFALPGGYIGINAGLITTTEDESELAAVMAHEISHVTQRHLARAFFHNSNMQGPLLAALLAGLLIGGEAAKAAIAATSAGAAQSQINFTRKNEEEADRIGIDLLGRSGYDPYGMATVFDKMHRQSRLYGGAPPEFLSTHPVHASRISEARSRAGRYTGAHRPNSLDYRVVRSRLKVLTSKNPGKLASDLRRSLQEGQFSDEEMHRYTLAFAQMEAGLLDDAEQQLTILLDQQIGNQAIQLLKVELDMRKGKDQSAIKRMQQLYQAAPDDYVNVMEFARVLIHLEQADRALGVLESYLVYRQGDPGIYRALSQASKRAGNSVKSHAYMAEFHILRGDLSQAIAHLESALRKPITDYYLESTLQAKLKQLREQQDDATSKDKKKSSGTG